MDLHSDFKLKGEHTDFWLVGAHIWPLPRPWLAVSVDVPQAQVPLGRLAQQNTPLGRRHNTAHVALAKLTKLLPL